MLKQHQFKAPLDMASHHTQQRQHRTCCFKHNDLPSCLLQVRVQKLVGTHRREVASCTFPSLCSDSGGENISTTKQGACSSSKAAALQCLLAHSHHLTVWMDRTPHILSCSLQQARKPSSTLWKGKSMGHLKGSNT